MILSHFNTPYGWTYVSFVSILIFYFVLIFAFQRNLFINIFLNSSLNEAWDILIGKYLALLNKKLQEMSTIKL